MEKITKGTLVYSFDHRCHMWISHYAYPIILSIYAFLHEYNRLPYLNDHCISTEEGLTRELLFSLKLPNPNITFGVL